MSAPVRRTDIPEPAELAHCPFCGSLSSSVSAHSKRTVWEFMYLDQYGHCWLTKAAQP